MSAENVELVHRAGGRSRPGAPEQTFRRASVWTVRDHEIVRADFYTPVAEALAAAEPEG